MESPPAASSEDPACLVSVRSHDLLARDFSSSHTSGYTQPAKTHRYIVLLYLVNWWALQRSSSAPKCSHPSCSCREGIFSWDFSIVLSGRRGDDSILPLDRQCNAYAVNAWPSGGFRLESLYRHYPASCEFHRLSEWTSCMLILGLEGCWCFSKANHCPYSILLPAFGFALISFFWSVGEVAKVSAGC